MGQLAVVACWSVLWALVRASADVKNVPVDDACDDEGECGISLRQLRGELRFAEAEVHDGEVPALADADKDDSVHENLAEVKSAEDEEPAGVQEMNLLQLADTDGDGEVQHAEALSFVDSLRSHSQEDSLVLFQAQDADSSSGLNGREFADALGAWGSGCSSHHVSTYCSGSHRVCCCHHGPTWSNCGCHGHHYNPYGGGGHYHSSSYHHYGYR